MARSWLLLGFVGCAGLGGPGWIWFVGGLCQDRAKPVEAALNHSAPVGDPVLRRAERDRIEAAGARPTDLLGTDQAPCLKHPHVLEGRSQGHAQRPAESAHRRRIVKCTLQYISSGGPAVKQLLGQVACCVSRLSCAATTRGAGGTGCVTEAGTSPSTVPTDRNPKGVCRDFRRRPRPAGGRDRGPDHVGKGVPMILLSTVNCGRPCVIGVG